VRGREAAPEPESEPKRDAERDGERSNVARRSTLSNRAGHRVLIRREAVERVNDYQAARFVHGAGVYGEVVSISDTQFRVGVGVAGIVLVAGIATVSFCGGVSLPAKPAAPVIARGTSRELFTRSSASPSVYLDFLASDATAAGVHMPTIEELSRKLPDRVDSARHVLEVGEPALALAGLELRAVRATEGLALEITNATGADVAYEVVTAPIPAAACDAASPRPFNAMTIAKGQVETRIECSWRDGIALAVTRVETLELQPLSIWYVNHVPPTVVGIEPRIARGHRSPDTRGRCAAALPQSVRSGLERGEISWRDLVDFYARHRCETYHFPIGYRAFSADSERHVPAVAAGM